MPTRNKNFMHFFVVVFEVQTITNNTVSFLQNSDIASLVIIAEYRMRLKKERQKMSTAN